MKTPRPPLAFHDGATLYPRWSLFLRRAQTLLAFLGAAAAIGLHGRHRLSWELASLLIGLVVVAHVSAMMVLGIRYQWSRKRLTFLEQSRFEIAQLGIWLLGMALISFLAAISSEGVFHQDYALMLVRWSELLAIFRMLHEASGIIHYVAQTGLNPALVLVLSFATLIAVGTILLMLPRSRPIGEPAAPFLKALFTATSASCVTGLVLDPPGQYWSRTGQLIILGMIQLGGLGIMTFSAFFALALGGRLPVREQVTFRELLESDRMGDVGSMIRAILLVTFSIEMVGAVLLMSLWPDLPLLERIYQAVFHSVSAFCNAGFSLRANNLAGLESHWQVWGVFSLLIILGGLGFNAIDHWQRYLRHRYFRPRGTFVSECQAPPRLSLTTRLVTITTLVLLISGTLLVFVFELDNPHHPLSPQRQLANAWFQSVTFRTAGFNTVDHEHLRPTTKLLAIVFMFIGASPGSTGGGVKTTCLALMFLTLRSVLRGRSAVETYGRRIPDEQVFRGLAMISLALATLMLAAFTIITIEDRPDRLIDQLYEAASAFGTAGVSANLTPTLKPASHVVLIVTMFLGRVGPLTLVVALAGHIRPRNVSYPEERLLLG